MADAGNARGEAGKDSKGIACLGVDCGILGDVHEGIRGFEDETLLGKDDVRKRMGDEMNYRRTRQRKLILRCVSERCGGRRRGHKALQIQERADWWAERKT